MPVAKMTGDAEITPARGKSRANERETAMIGIYGQLVTRVQQALFRKELEQKGASLASSLASRWKGFGQISAAPSFFIPEFQLYAMGPDYLGRKRNIRRLMKRKRIDALLISDHDDMFYYTGYREMKDERSLLLVTGEDMALILSPLREEAQETYDNVILLRRRSDLKKILRPFKKVGFDERNFSSDLYRFLREKRVKLVPCGDMIKKPRLIKEPWEIDQMRKALKVTRDVLQNTAMWNRKEKDVANKIKLRFLRHNVELAFDPIVASGRQTSFVHHRPNHKLIKLDDMVLIDIGCRFNGYCSDITRMFCRKPKSHQKKVLADIKKIHNSLMNKIKRGISVSSLDGEQKKLMKRFGYRERHRFGHSVGLSVHEDLGKKLKDGMVITVEPGIYVKNEIGARLEDMILINKGKPEVLSKSI